LTSDSCVFIYTFLFGRAECFSPGGANRPSVGFLMRFARQWVAGETQEDALRAAHQANARGIDAIINHLGEHHEAKALVDGTLNEYASLLRRMRETQVRGTISVKPTQFGLLIGREYALSRLLVLLDVVRADGRDFWLDMESARTTTDTIWVYDRLLARYDQAGLCLQANLRRTESDLKSLLDEGARIRLTKGAYRETPEVAFATRTEVDRQFLRHLETLFREGRNFAVASHDGRMIQRALELGASTKTPFEFQMLQGVRDPLKDELVRGGHRVLEYIPYGAAWLPYFTRRLQERPRNVVTMMRSFVTG